MILYMELHTGSSGEWLNMSNVKVAVRVRPLNQRWVNISLSLKQKVLQLVKLQESHLFTFKKVEPEKCYFEFWDYWFIFLQWKGWKWQIHRGGSWRQSQHPQCKGRSGSNSICGVNTSIMCVIILCFGVIVKAEICVKCYLRANLMCILNCNCHGFSAINVLVYAL